MAHNIVYLNEQISLRILGSETPIGRSQRSLERDPIRDVVRL